MGWTWAYPVETYRNVPHVPRRAVFGVKNAGPLGERTATMYRVSGSKSGVRRHVRYVAVRRGTLEGYRA